MLIFAAIGMAGFLLLLILWLWVLPDREGGPRWWLWVAVLLTFFGLAGACVTSVLH
jgi:hypothetical protein